MTISFARTIKQAGYVVAVTAAVVGFGVFGAGVAYADSYEYGIPQLVSNYAYNVQMPSNVQIVERKKRALTVEWNTDVRTIATSLSDAAVVDTTYTVSVYKRKSGEFVNSVTTTDTRATVTGLKKGRRYTLQVVASRGGFVSEAAVVNAKTLLRGSWTLTGL